MALGFKIADGYVEVHAHYDKGELQKAAQAAADDTDRAYNKERAANSKSGDTRNTNRQIGRQANADFVQGVREQVNRQKENPFIKVEDVKKDMSRLGRVSVAEFHRGADEDVKRSGRWRALGSRIGMHLKQGILGKDNAGVAGVAFFKRFVEAATFGQADFSSPKITGKLSRTFAALGTAAGVTFAGFLIAEIGNLITAGLPVLLGGALAALPIIGLIRTGMTKEHGHWKTETNEMGRALHKLVVEFKSFMKIIEAPMKAPLFDILKAAGGSLEYIAKPMRDIIAAISPGVAKLFYGFFGFIREFVDGLKPALPGINAGLTEFGRQLPGLARALTAMITTILKDPDKVVQAVKDLFSTLRALAVTIGVVVTAATALARWMHAIGGVIISVARVVMQAGAAWRAFKTVLAGVWNSIKTTALSVWNSIKAVTISTWNTIKNAVKTAIATVKGVIVSGVNAIKRVWNAFWGSSFGKLVKNAWGLVKDIVKLSMAVIGALIKTGLAVMKAVWTKTWNAVKTVASAVWNNIKSVITKALSAIFSTVSSRTAGIRSKIVSAWNAVKSATSSAWNAVKSVVAAAWRAIASAVTAGVNKVASLARSIKGKVLGALAGAGSWLYNAGRQIIQGLLNGINSLISSVRSKLQSLTALIKASKGPPERDKVLLYDAGRLIMQGLMRGIDSKTGALQSQLGGLTNSIPGMAGAGGGATYNQQSSWSPTIVLNVAAGLDPVNAAARRALTKDLFLALEQYRKDYVDR
jgi:phage-related protein